MAYGFSSFPLDLTSSHLDEFITRFTGNLDAVKDALTNGGTGGFLVKWDVIAGF
jgi:hypothetical protein